MTSAARPLAVWRDLDHRYRRIGFAIWLTGAQVSVGRRRYVVRWAFRG